MISEKTSCKYVSVLRHNHQNHNITFFHYADVPISQCLTDGTELFSAPGFPSEEALILYCLFWEEQLVAFPFWGRGQITGIMK